MNFRSSLAALDRMPTRYCDSTFVLYCKKGQTRAEDILSHQVCLYVQPIHCPFFVIHYCCCCFISFSQRNLHSKPQEYMEFLHGLGWIVDPVKHPGFSGRLRPESEEGSQSIGLSAQIPYRPFPYHTDAINEMAFIQPILRQSTSNSASSVRSIESSDSGPEVGSIVSESIPCPGSTYHAPPMCTAPALTGSGVQESSAQADGERSLRGSIKGTGSVSGGLPNVPEADTPRRRATIPQDCAAIVVWLECFEDHLQFPLEAMSKLLHKNYCKGTKDFIPAIFVHKLASDLYQIVTRCSSR